MMLPRPEQEAQQAKYEALGRALQEECAAREEAEAERDDLRGALAPFAAYGRYLKSGDAPKGAAVRYTPAVQMPTEADVPTVGDFYRALEALRCAQEGQTGATPGPRPQDAPICVKAGHSEEEATP